jgi:cellulose synthase/poly-beta-1,6-N-acetylglucosamine synthase-like glycosyltransferase
MINLLILLFISLLIYYCFFLISILRGLVKLNPVLKKKPASESISIIIPFRNEEEIILDNLRSIEAQNYPEEKFEVIYVDDSSTDNSFNILASSIHNKNIKVLSLPENKDETAHKKRAVNLGIENSNGEIIVTTDADCKYTPDWLINLVSSFDQKVGFVSGPVELADCKNIFSRVQQLEFAGLILTGAGLIGIKQPVICNAANIAYRKEIFKNLHGFEGQLHISSGDDGFLMQKIHRKTNYNVKFCLNRRAVVKTKSLDTIGQFYNQRKRWASKSIYYPDKKLITKLVLIFLFYFGLIVQFFSGFLFSNKFFILLTASLVLKFLLEFLILKRGKEILFPRLELKYFLFTELFQIPYIIISSISGLFGDFTWKGRKIKR